MEREGFMRLRCAVILVAILVLSAGPSVAQPVTGGVKAGANFSKITFGEFDEDLDRKTGLVIGAFITVPMTELFAFQPEMLYSVKGGKFEQPDGDEFKTNLNFLQIPLLFRANFAVGTFRPFAVVGPAFGFRTGANFDGPGEGDVDITDDTNAVEFSGVIGGGLQFGLVSVELRYDHGFNDLDDIESAEIKTRTFSVLVGFDFARFRDR